MALDITKTLFMLAVVLQICTYSEANGQYQHGDIRLVGGSYPWEGRVEIYMLGTWGTVTDTNWSSIDAQVVCRKRGYFKPGAIPLSNGYFGQGSSGIHMDLVLCYGLEYSLTECETANSTRRTTHYEDVGVICQPAPGSYQHGNIRLVGGSTNLEGRVEVYISGAWATIDDSLWTTADAQVVCRQMGHSTDDATAHYCCTYGQGSGSTHIDQVDCQGSEPNITSCSHYSSTNGANHFTDVGVQCQPGTQYREGDVRLIGGAYSWEGRVEIYLFGTWGTVGHSSADIYDAQVVCRQLGYDTRYGAADISRPWAYFGLGFGPIHLNNLQCSGREHRLISCRHSSNTYHHNQDWSVTCNNDGPEPGEVRLYYSYWTNSDYRGRVEVFLSETWGRVTGSWTTANAEIVCHQLGYDIPSSDIYPTSYYSSSNTESRPIHLSDVTCTGAEYRLTDCSYSTRRLGEDATMRCLYSNARCYIGDTRLVGGQTEWEGRVEVCSNNRWGTVCDKQWSPSHTGVVCRHLGYEDNNSSYFLSVHFGEGTWPIKMDYVNCSGSEFRLWDCNHFTHSYGCTHSNDVGVRCQPVVECHHPTAYCTNPAQCKDGDIRIVEGETDLEGRVEVCLVQRWGTVSSRGWSTTDAQIVCNQLGYSNTGASVMGCCGTFGQGGGPIYLTYVSCTGSEFNLLDCTSSNDTSIDTHIQDVGVQCQPALCQDGEVRLVEGRREWEGRLEVCLSQRWGTVSSDGWTVAESQVVCRDLGYEINVQNENMAVPARNSKPVWIRNVACSGAELTLLECSHDSATYEDDHSKDVGVHCQQPACLDGDIRLADGGTEFYGLLEVCFNQRWGTVNSGGWSTVDTQVACKQLGHQTTDVSFSLSGHSKKISAPIFMDNVACLGSEDKLIDCTYHTDTSEDDHSADIQVHCKPYTNAMQGSSTSAISVVALTLALIVSLIAVVAGSIFILVKYKKKGKNTSSTAKVQHDISLRGTSVAGKVTETLESNRYAGRPLPYEPVQPAVHQSTSAAPYQPLRISGQVVPEPYETCETTSSQANNPQDMPAVAAEDMYESCT